MQLATNQQQFPSELSINKHNGSLIAKVHEVLENHTNIVSKEQQGQYHVFTFNVNNNTSITFELILIKIDKY